MRGFPERKVLPITKKLAPHGVEIDMVSSPAPELFSNADGMPGPNYKGFTGRSTEVLPKGYRETPDSKPLESELLCEYNISVPMRDGTIIYADVRRPVSSDPAAKVPAIFAWCPYGKAHRGYSFHRFVPPVIV
ncbi:hypothetical protein B0T10DRAFT_551212 [Thelonectria olida]|uniref:Xaa-Pro dipeptidyl-peptidase-like domain-containing protein n=1 Tax=Thelonectria olida TaxID=1576542 RepID=A0A9P9AKZ6_9HYPO|nr:hypothetical protein B0T10DRAFT_551212 [Thelonectria olida]